MWKIRLDDIRDGLAEAERFASDEPVGPWPERAARARRWLELGGDRERFAALAEATEAEVENWHARLLCWFAGIWHLAGRADRASAYATRALSAPHIKDYASAGCLYLLGDYERAAGSGADDASVQIAQARVSGDVSLLALVREKRLLPYAVGDGRGPHASYSGDPLTSWDWLEETFFVEAELSGVPVPSHEEMLRRLGVLSDAPRPGPPVPRSPALGLRLDGPGGAELEVADETDVRVRVPGCPTVWLRQEFELWGACLLDDEEDDGEWIVEPIYPDWRHAASEAARIVGRDYDAQAGRVVGALAVTADGDAGEPVAAPTPPPSPAQPSALPTIRFRTEQIIYIQLADDLYVDLRESPEGWSARVAEGLVSPRVDAIPASSPSWRDVAARLVDWLNAHRGGHGVPELEQLLADPAAYDVGHP